MKHLISILILGILFPLISLSQEQNWSSIYNHKGQLRIDTTLKITQKQYKVWCIVENNLLSHLSSNIEYTSFLQEIQKTGTVIISFECDTFELREIHALTKINQGIDSAAIKGLVKIQDELILEFRLTEYLKREKQIDYLGIYYIPIDFSLLNLKECMKNKSAIPIFGKSLVPISRIME
jgi:hypothetical protein